MVFVCFVLDGGLLGSSFRGGARGVLFGRFVGLMLVRVWRFHLRLFRADARYHLRYIRESTAACPQVWDEPQRHGKRP